MSADYFEALNILEQISMSGSKPGLERINKLLLAIGNPQKKLKCAIVAGTNGKGSTTKYLSKILEAGGYKTGSFFSPHIFSFQERIQINSKQISKKDFANIFFRVYEKCKSFAQKPTFFEVITAMAFLHFYECNCDYAIMETGMGGRLDATNACEPILSIITNISLEHTKHLGNTIEKIAFEKSGIMRAGKPIICGAVSEDLKILESLAKNRGAKFYSVKNKFEIIKKTKSSLFVSFNFKKPFVAKLKTNADFLATNCACAVMAAQIICVGNSKIILGIKNTKLFGRWQKISNSPKIIIDCAHNLGAFLQIEPLIKKEFDSNSILLFAAMSDKDYVSELKILSKYFNSVVFCSLDFERAESLQKLKQVAKELGFLKIYSVEKPADAYSFAKSTSRKNGSILICGSIYLLQNLFSKKGNFILG